MCMQKRMIWFGQLLIVLVSVATSASAQKGPPIENLISQVQDSLLIIAQRLPEEQLPPLNNAEITLQTTIGKSAKGSFEFFVITFGGKIEQEEAQQIVMTLTPPSPKTPAPAASSEFSKSFADAIVAAARGAHKATARKPALELGKLVASISFVVKSSGEGGAKLEFVPITLNFGGGISRANTHKVQLTFGKSEKKG